MGIPDKILTDQEENYTSKLLSELYKMLYIHQLQRSPYHLLTNGLVKRFNQSLKSMLKKATKSEGKYWNKMLHHLLFAYREVPQSFVGFSPFEHLYRQVVNGPLDVLKNTWKAGGPGEDSVVSHIFSICDKLAKTTELVKNNLSKAQEKQRKWYNSNTHLQEVQARTASVGASSHIQY